MHRRSLVAVFTLALLASACSQTTAGAADPDGPVPPALATAQATEQSGDQVVRVLAPEMQVTVVGQRPHDPSAFTQGLEFEGNRLFESRGLYGESAITEIDPATGEVLNSTDLSLTYWGEGLTIVDGQAIQITWRNNLALVYDLDTLEQTAEFTYEGEGWGLCDADGVLYMTDGTSTLTQRDATTFEVLNTVEVLREDLPVERLNEVECVGGLVWANVWQTDEILAIDPATGRVVSTIDASPIALESGRWRQDPEAANVLNGLAYDPNENVWLVTGKLWPVMYEVVFEDITTVSMARAYYGRSTG